MSEHYTSRIDPEANVAVIEASGIVTPEGFYDAQDRLLEDSDWRADTDLMIVLRDDVSLKAITFGKLDKFAAPFQTWSIQHRRGARPLTAIVCQRGIIAMARHFWNTIRKDDWVVEVAILTSQDEAMSWIHDRRQSALTSA